MGTWGIGLFEDDITMDVKDYFDDYFSRNSNILEVCDKILNLLKEEAKDEDEGPLIYFALAELQMDRGVLERSIKEKCLECLRSGKSMERWMNSGIIQFFQRRSVLKKFSTRLKKFTNVMERKAERENTDVPGLTSLKYTVYILEDSNSQPRYIGRTSCFEKRKLYMEKLFIGFRSKVAEPDSFEMSK